jgi:hypothetical protein
MLQPAPGGLERGLKLRATPEFAAAGHRANFNGPAPEI